jgi:hypothetical protein
LMPFGEFVSRLQSWDPPYVLNAWRKSCREMRSRGDMPHLLHLLDQFRDRQCNVPRDRIFSLLGLAQEGKNIAVDYNLSPEYFAYTTLRACGPKLCFCSVLLVNHVLETNESRPKNSPYVEFEVAKIPFQPTESRIFCFAGAFAIGYLRGAMNVRSSTERDCDIFRIPFYALSYVPKSNVVRLCPGGAMKVEPRTPVRIGFFDWNFLS